MHQLQWQKLPFKIQILALSNTMKKTISALQTWQEANCKSILSSVGLVLKALIEYLGEWEMLYNSDFNCTEFGTIKNAAGSNNFVLSVKTWIERTGAIGIRSKAGRYGGTYAHRDIAYHFGMWFLLNSNYFLLRSISG